MKNNFAKRNCPGPQAQAQKFLVSLFSKSDDFAALF